MAKDTVFQGWDKCCFRGGVVNETVYFRVSMSAVSGVG